MPRLSRAAKILIAFLILVVGGYFLGKSNLSSSAVPGEFMEARMQGALIAQDIVNIANRMGEDLKRVNDLDRKGAHAKALALTVGLIEQSREVRSRAVDLSSQLEKMTVALAMIKSFEAKEAALSSISNRMILINHLINYGEYLAELLGALENRFRGASGEDVANWVNIINAEVAAINEFNAQAGQAMDRFDSIVRNR